SRHSSPARRSSDLAAAAATAATAALALLAVAIFTMVFIRGGGNGFFARNVGRGKLFTLGGKFLFRAVIVTFGFKGRGIAVRLIARLTVAAAPPTPAAPLAALLTFAALAIALRPGVAIAAAFAFGRSFRFFRILGLIRHV